MHEPPNLAARQAAGAVTVEHVEGGAEQLLCGGVVEVDPFKLLEHVAPLADAVSHQVLVVAPRAAQQPQPAEGRPDRARRVLLVAKEDHARDQHNPDRDKEEARRAVDSD